MNYWGKLVGTVAGLASGRPWLALVGLVLGHQFDRGFGERFRDPGDESSWDSRTRLPERFVKALFQAMGHLAKADGRVSEDEIRAARALMHRLNLSPASVREAIRWFEEGKAQTFPLLATVRKVNRDTARTPQLRGLFVRLLMEVSLAKSAIDRRERSLLWTICSELDIGRVELAQLEAMLRAQRAFRKSPAGAADAERVADAYSVLGVDRASSNDEIKTAYRRLMNKHHPDKIAGSDPDDAALAAAQKKTRDIRSAYETLKTRRLIR